MYYSIRLPGNLLRSVFTYLFLPPCCCRAAAAICAPVLAWAWNRYLRYWYYEYSPIAYPGDVKPERLQRRYAVTHATNTNAIASTSTVAIINTAANTDTETRRMLSTIFSSCVLNGFLIELRVGTT